MKLLRCIVIVTVSLSAAYCMGKPVQLPSGPAGAGEFGAYYTHLKYTSRWDEPWRVGEYSDVVVQFDDDGHKFVFWRGTSYIPCWVNDRKVWYTNEFVERRGAHSPNTKGCVEPMSDKQCRFSQVSIIENNEARVVIHWRYAPVDVHYEHPFIDPQTGWGDWVDEYYTIYPDAVGVRKITAYSTHPEKWMEFQESIVINQPGTLPDDNIEYDAVSLANMAGETKTYRWTEDGGPDFDGEPDKANILRINLKGRLKTFAFVMPPEGNGLITPYSGHGRRSHFNWWDHWPVSQVASDGRGATSKDKPSHSSLCHIGLPGKAKTEWKPYKEGKNFTTKIMVHGLTDKGIEDLVPLAKSWVSPAKLQVKKGDFSSEGYDQTQMAYVLAREGSGGGSELEFKLSGSASSPVINPAFVIKGWGDRDAEVEINGEENEGARTGYRNTLEGTDLIVWVKLEEAEPVTVSIESDG